MLMVSTAIVVPFVFADYARLRQRANRGNSDAELRCKSPPIGRSGIYTAQIPQTVSQQV
ncbi:MAG: hypothetical protein ACI8W8_002952, partial [Rhodothermales bacterium]